MNFKWINLEDIPERGWIVVCEGDPSKVAVTPCKESSYPTFKAANDWMTRLQDSPQCDYALKVISLNPVIAPQEAQRREMRKSLWIDKFGSDHLRAAYKQGYPCELLYISTRARYEGFRGYVVDLDNSIKTEAIDSPSVAAIKEVELVAIYKPRHHVKIVNMLHVHHNGHSYPFKEACIVKFHGATLYKIMYDGVSYSMELPRPLPYPIPLEPAARQYAPNSPPHKR